MLIQSLILLMAQSFELHASESLPWKKFETMKCQKEFVKMAEEKMWDKEIFREHVSSYNDTVYRNLSSTVGEWIEVHFKNNAPAEVVFLKDTTLTRFSYDSSCDLKVKNEALSWDLNKVFSKKTAEDWSNEDLKNTIASGKKGMIYYWSPRFSYSVYDLPRMERLARKFGYEFTAVVDPRASKEEVLGALDVMKTKFKMNRALASQKSFFRNTSTDIYMRSGFNHFPVTYVYTNNMIHPRWITGIMKDNGLKVMADTMVGELK